MMFKTEAVILIIFMLAYLNNARKSRHHVHRNDDSSRQTDHSEKIIVPFEYEENKKPEKPDKFGENLVLSEYKEPSKTSDRSEEGLTIGEDKKKPNNPEISKDYIYETVQDGLSDLIKENFEIRHKEKRSSSVTPALPVTMLRRDTEQRNIPISPKQNVITYIHTIMNNKNDGNQTRRLANKLKLEMARNTAARTRGGKDQDLTDYPFIAAILIYGQLWCAGAIVHVSFVLTAAHCLNYVDMVAHPEHRWPVQVRVGSTNAMSGGQLLKIKGVFRHPDFEQEPPPHADVSFLRLEEDLVYSDVVDEIALTRGIKEPLAQSFVYVIGFGGTTGNNAKEFENINEQHTLSARVKVTRKEYCNDAYGSIADLRITDDFFCASLRGGVRDTCLLDSGSPAVQDGNLVGIMSVGPDNCGRDDGPAVFIKSYYFKEFVNVLIKNRNIEIMEEITSHKRIPFSGSRRLSYKE